VGVEKCDGAVRGRWALGLGIVMLLCGLASGVVGGWVGWIGLSALLLLLLLLLLLFRGVKHVDGWIKIGVGS